MADQFPAQQDGLVFHVKTVPSKDDRYGAVTTVTDQDGRPVKNLQRVSFYHSAGGQPEITLTVLGGTCEIAGPGQAREEKRVDLPPGYYQAERYCPHCDKDTQHDCKDSGHERDSSGDYQECEVCGWWMTGMCGKYNPPLEDWAERAICQ